MDQMSEAGSLYNINFLQTTISSTSDILAAVQAANNPNIDILVIVRVVRSLDTESINKL